MKSQSVIRTAITQAKDKPRGLMKFFKQISKGEYNEQVQRHTAEEDEFSREWKERNDAAERRQAEKAKEDARERQQKHQRRVYDAEITKGERSPGGTKRKVSKTFNHITHEINSIILARTCRT